MALQRRRGSGDEGRRLVSPFYAALGSQFAQALRVCEGDGRAAERMLGDYDAWAREYRELWLAGDRLAPPPPHEAAFGYAGPA